MTSHGSSQAGDSGSAVLPSGRVDRSPEVPEPPRPQRPKRAKASHPAQGEMKKTVKNPGLERQASDGRYLAGLPASDCVYQKQPEKGLLCPE